MQVRCRAPAGARQMGHLYLLVPHGASWPLAAAAEAPCVDLG